MNRTLQLLHPEHAFPAVDEEGIVEHILGTLKVCIRPFRTLGNVFHGGELLLPDNSDGIIAVRWSDGAVVTVPLGGPFGTDHQHIIAFTTRAGMVRWLPLLDERPELLLLPGGGGVTGDVWVAPRPGSTDPGGGTNDDPFNSNAPGFDVDALLQDARYRVYHFAPGTYPLTGGYNLKPNIEVHGAGSALRQPRVHHHGLI